MNVIESEPSREGGVLIMTKRPIPQPGPGEMLIRVVASGVNRPDILQRKGRYPPPPGASDILGLEVAGFVESGAAHELEAAGWRIADPVCALLTGGGYAQYCVAPITQCLPIPKGLTLQQAASLPEACFTVWSTVFERGALRRGQTVLIQGGSSGIGVYAIQLAKAFGAQVLVTVRTAHKAQVCLDLGADRAIIYPDEDFSAVALQLTQGRGVDLILDMVAGDYVQRELACLADEGCLMVIATQGGSKAFIDMSAILHRRLHIQGATLRARSIQFKAQLAQAIKATVWPWIEQQLVKPLVYRSFLAQDVLQAHALMESGEMVGKLVLTWPTHAEH